MYNNSNPREVDADTLSLRLSYYGRSRASSARIFGFRSTSDQYEMLDRGTVLMRPESSSYGFVCIVATSIRYILWHPIRTTDRYLVWA